MWISPFHSASVIALIKPIHTCASFFLFFFSRQNYVTSGNNIRRRARAKWKRTNEWIQSDKQKKERWFAPIYPMLKRVQRLKDYRGTHTHTDSHTCADRDLDTHRLNIYCRRYIEFSVFPFELAVKAFCVTVRAAGFPDGCGWMLSVRWILGLHACYDYDIINTHSKWEWEQTGLVWTGRGLFISKMHSLKLCSLLWLIGPGETEPGRPLLWPWHCPG